VESASGHTMARSRRTGSFFCAKRRVSSRSSVRDTCLAAGDLVETSPVAVPTEELHRQCYFCAAGTHVTVLGPCRTSAKWGRSRVRGNQARGRSIESRQVYLPECG